MEIPNFKFSLFFALLYLQKYRCQLFSLLCFVFIFIFLKILIYSPPFSAMRGFSKLSPYLFFYYASIRPLSLWRSFSECFFDLGSAISRCGTMILRLSCVTPGGNEVRVAGRNVDNKKNFKKHIISSIITSKDFYQ